MKVDVWYDFRNPPRWQRDDTALYGELLEQIEWVDTLGFSTVWLSEHHFTDEGYLPGLMPMLAALAMRTSRVRLGTAVLLAPLYHPLRLAEEAAVVDILSGGRLDLGIAPGYRVSEFAAMGVDKRERGGRTDEIIELLLQAWRSGSVTADGRYYRYQDVPVTPRPVQRPIPIWIGGSTLAAARRAGRHGLAFMPDSGSPAEVYPAYREACAAAGHPPGEIATNMVVYVCDDPEQGWNDVKEHYFYVYQTYQRWFAEAGDLIQVGTPLTDPDQLSRQTHIVGTPETVVEAIRARRQRYPFDRLIFWARPPGLPIEQSTRSLELFATKVLPQIAEGPA